MCLILARDQGWTCVTNDGRLRRACADEGVAVLWGLQLMVKLVEAGELSADDAISVAEAIGETNSWLSKRGIARLEPLASRSKFITPEAVSKGRSSRTCSTTPASRSCHASSCWKSASEWKTGRRSVSPARMPTTSDEVTAGPGELTRAAFGLERTPDWQGAPTLRTPVHASLPSQRGHGSPHRRLRCTSGRAWLRQERGSLPAARRGPPGSLAPRSEPSEGAPSLAMARRRSLWPPQLDRRRDLFDASVDAGPPASGRHARPASRMATMVTPSRAGG